MEPISLTTVLTYAAVAAATVVGTAVIASATAPSNAQMPAPPPVTPTPTSTALDPNMNPNKQQQQTIDNQMATIFSSSQNSVNDTKKATAGSAPNGAAAPGSTFSTATPLTPGMNDTGKLGG